MLREGLREREDTEKPCGWSRACACDPAELLGGEKRPDDRGWDASRSSHRRLIASPAVRLVNGMVARRRTATIHVLAGAAALHRNRQHRIPVWANTGPVGERDRSGRAADCGHRTFRACHRARFLTTTAAGGPRPAPGAQECMDRPYRNSLTPETRRRRPGCPSLASIARLDRSNGLSLAAEAKSAPSPYITVACRNPYILSPRFFWPVAPKSAPLAQKRLRGGGRLRRPPPLRQKAHAASLWTRAVRSTSRSSCQMQL